MLFWAAAAERMAGVLKIGMARLIEAVSKRRRDAGMNGDSLARAMCPVPRFASRFFQWRDTACVTLVSNDTPRKPVSGPPCLRAPISWAVPADQEFPRDQLGPTILPSVMTHDSQFAFGERRDFLATGTLHEASLVSCDGRLMLNLGPAPTSAD